MKGRVSKGWRRSQRLQEQLSNAVARQGGHYQYDHTALAQNTPTPSPKLPFNQASVEGAKVQKKKPKPPSALFLDVHPRRRVILNWLESVGSNRNIRCCRSDSHLQLQPTHDDEHILGRMTSSVPAMDVARNVDGDFLGRWIPTTASFVGTGTRSGFPLIATPGKRLVEQPFYRVCNLRLNNIVMLSLHEHDQLPNQVTDLITLVRRSRDSPGVTHGEVLQDQELEAFGIHDQAEEKDVAAYFKNKILPGLNKADCLQLQETTQMPQCTVPNIMPDFRVSIPQPDMLYGYNLRNAFPSQWHLLTPLLRDVAANNGTRPLLYPFFIIKFKGDEGSMWVATNQCLGAASSSINIMEDLNYRLQLWGSKKVINSAVFGIAANGSETRLYVSWMKREQDEVMYYTALVRSFLLQDPEHYIEFHNTIRNIIDWGRGQRLNEIREAMNFLLEESRRRASEEAKYRDPSPSINSPGMARKRPKKACNKAANETAQKLRRSSRKRKQDE